MSRLLLAFICIALYSLAQGASTSPLDFQTEATRVTKAISCSRPKVTPSGMGLGALYGCIAGAAETAKFFINEAEGTGKVENIKVMWNDWFIDAGYGIHADKEQAQFFVKAFSKLYASGEEQKLMSIFLSNSDAIIDAGDYQIAYTYRRGPKIDERLLVLTPKSVLASTAQVIRESDTDFTACKVAVSKAVGYSESLLSGDGEPIRENEYNSFMLKGRGKDLFFCEVHPGSRYKVRAALNGEYPFKDIAQGRF